MLHRDVVHTVVSFAQSAVIDDYERWAITTICLRRGGRKKDRTAPSLASHECHMELHSTFVYSTVGSFSVFASVCVASVLYKPCTLYSATARRQARLAGRTKCTRGKIQV